MKYLAIKAGQQGFSLIEVLITAFILAVGLLGLAALQSKSLQYNHGAYLRSQATILAYDMADRMRLNRASAIAGNYNVAYGTTPTSGTSLASQDLSQWKAKLIAMLGASGDGAVNCAANDCSISVRWLERSGTDADPGAQAVNAVPIEFVYDTQF